MRRVFRQFLTFILLFAAVGVVRISLADYSQWIQSKLVSAAQQAGISAEASGLELSFPGTISVSELKLELPTRIKPIPFSLSSVVAKVEWLKVFGLNPGIALDSEFLDGQIRGNISSSIFGTSQAFDLGAKELRLEKHPLLKELAISGKLSINASGSQKSDSSGKTELKLSEGAYRGNYSVAGIVKIPTLEQVDGSAEVVLLDNSLDLKRLSISTSLGTISASGTCKLSQLKHGEYKPVKASLNASIVLNEEGRKSIGGYLALAAGRATESPPAAWKLDLTHDFTAPMPKVVLKPN